VLETRYEVHRDPPGLGASLWAALAAALTLALVGGVADASWTELRAPGAFAEGGGLERAGSYGAAVLTHLAWQVLLLVPAALLLHGWFASTPRGVRFGRLFALGLFVLLGAVVLSEVDPWARASFAPDGPRDGRAALLLLAVQLILAAALAYGLARFVLRLPRFVHRGLRILGLAALVAGGLHLRAESQERALRSRTSATAELPNLLWVVADALPTTGLACLGATESASPRLDRLAERGVALACDAPSPDAAANLASLLTGELPRRHGLPAASGGTAPREVTTLAQRLDRAGISCAAFGQGPLAARVLAEDSGLLPGFDTHGDPELDFEPVEVASAWSAFRLRLLPWRLARSLAGPAEAERVVDRARDWMRDRAAERWMTLVLLEPPDDTERAAWIDARLGELLDGVDALGLRERTLVVFTAARGAVEVPADAPAGSLSSAVLSAPVVLAQTRHLPHGARPEELVSAVDLAPTLADCLEVEGADFADGRSFLPFVLGTQLGEVAQPEPRRFAMAEDDQRIAVRNRSAMLIVFRENAAASAGRHQYFELVKESGRTRDVPARAELEDMTALVRALLEFDRAIPRREASAPVPAVPAGAPFGLGGEVQAKEPESD